MSIARQGPPGTTRSCPHCHATILDSASVCPACRHHLRFNPAAVEREPPSFSALKVDGTIRHPGSGEAWEYSVSISIRNERGDEITRQVVGVGALRSAEQRTFTFAVDVFTPAGSGTAGKDRIAG
jgi:hypothetical protein